MSATGTDLCRVTVVTPRGFLDLGLPPDIPLGNLLPTLLRIAGESLAEAGLAHGGWVLQRLGGPPFAPDATLAELAVHDGELLHLRPRGHELPEVVFDDVADAVATGVLERTGRWQPATTRTYGLRAAAALLVLGAAALPTVGPPWPPVALVTGAVALVLLLVAVALSRALGDAASGAAIGYAALPYGFLAGLTGPASGTALLEPDNLLAACGVLLMLATATGFAVAGGLPAFLGVAVAALAGLVASGLVMAYDLHAAGVASVLAALAVGLTTAIPALSVRLAGMPLPALPTTAEELRREGGDLDGELVLDRTVVADRFCTGLLGAVALIVLAAQALLLLEGTWTALAMSGALSLSLLMRARVFEGRGQRAWLLSATLLGVALPAAGAVVTAADPTVLYLIVPGLVVLALAVAGTALWLATARPSPFWGRAGDILDILLMIALIPLALAVMDLYETIRGLVS
ncbi:putative membrane protein [[Actinomadura] parvosata subsp. kistnae]|uniref:Type VII secretion integral membrane protein EccD n=1 Tax=[Actinomadura] parvosata subsp. kistnae TaxID=1909395 RepID=A0A1V0A5A9_9ACTN|nr:type VII secretion integral membrane protein EccD [Nonomuraea sp. ATCC 55076]AQZ65381.1 type VII secretion integral membrane protein EccD [Nonomuraea sp. ATCC 55076]SPL96709.1 putative membrane protein [Actinomadura parvosata subsp. kistnae]